MKYMTKTIVTNMKDTITRDKKLNYNIDGRQEIHPNGKIITNKKNK